LYSIAPFAPFDLLKEEDSILIGTYLDSISIIFDEKIKSLLKHVIVIPIRIVRNEYVNIFSFICYLTGCENTNN
jgi:hypothetical protein